ncbi:choice-of-anchor I family protein [Paenibacillus sp. FSL R10-2734]|uniref:choice-of-anchor I family protein n=1 Tax=Paenibacillus sp. FSL R10-2734 TaxID=2954691 RepID=UPI0030DA3362
MKPTGKAIVSLMLTAEILLGSAWMAGPAVAASVQSGTPYTADGKYDVSIPHIVVNQVYGGGNTADASGGYFSKGYVELYNPTDSDVSLAGWSVQYSDPKLAGQWSKLDLNGTIKAHSSYLITDDANNQDHKNDISTKGDQSWPGMYFNNSGMKVVLLSSTELLQVVNPFQTKPSSYVDMIGTASNNKNATIDGYEVDYPTGDTGGTSKKKSVRRVDFVDTDNNKVDFKQISFDSLDASTLALAKPHNSADGQWSVKVSELGISTKSLSEAKAGSPYSVTLSVYGGVQPYSYEAAGLPDGLSIDATSGNISGTPSKVGAATVSIAVYDSSTPRMKTEAVLSLNVAEAGGPVTPDLLSVTKIGGYSVGVTNKDGGVAEIVIFNRDNGKFYLVNGSSHPATVDIVNLKNPSNPQKEYSINVEQLSEVDGFTYGDLTSVDINTTTKRIAVAIQEEDAMKNGKVLVLDYDGKLLASYESGVQPDMVKYTDDGRYILTADEAEPRTTAGDPEGSVTIIDTLKNTSIQVKFDNPDVIDDLVHIRGAADPINKQITGKGEKKDVVRDLEPEFVVLSDDQTIAYVALQENNAIAAIDIASKKVLWVKGLGFKDLSVSLPKNALDLVKDNKVNLENVPFFGTFMPDGIDQYTVGGKTYLFTANEGDATEWDSKVNVSTVKKMKGSLNPESDAAKFLNENKDKYDSVEVMSDMGNDGIYLYGGRSFSIWEADSMNQVYDSGSDFEKITGERLPEYFNASNSNTTMDNRSTKKGPEPEYVKVGKVGQKALAFIGLERIGGLMTYEVTNPLEPSFVNYINTRDFTSANTLETDTAPEGIEFIPATSSPTGLPLVLVANEVGGTVAIYQLNVTKITLNQTSLSLKVGEASAMLEASVAPAEGGSNAVTWSSSNPSVASVDSNGKVNPLTKGTAVISAFSADGYGVAESTVTVAAADPVTTNPGPGTTVTPKDPVKEVTTPAVTTEGNKIIVEIKASKDAEGKLVASITSDMVTEALKSLANNANGQLVFRAKVDTAAGGVTLNIPSNTFTALAGSAAKSVVFEAGIGTITLDRNALSAVNTAAKGEDIKLSISSADTDGKGKAQAVIGSRPVLSLGIVAGSQPISNLGAGFATITVPYTLAANEDANAVVAYDLTNAGQAVVLAGSSYNAATGQLIFRTSQFSTYAVGYNKVSFSDIGSSFAKDSITYLAARDVITGIGEGKFGSKSQLTRADVTLLLARLAGADLSAEGAGNFTDVKADDYYAAAVAWANREGIVTGVSEGQFDPRANVTREQLSVMIVRLAKAMNWTLPVSGDGSAFADQKLISSYALEAATAAQQAGIISGKPAAGSSALNFAPKEKATREEIAQMLAKLLKLSQS